MQMSPVARMLDSFLCECYKKINDNTGLDLYRNPYNELMTELNKPQNLIDPSIEYVLIKRFMLIDLKFDNGPYNKIISESIDEGFTINGFAIVVVLDYDTANYIKINNNIMQLLCYLADKYKFDCGVDSMRVVDFDYLRKFGIDDGYVICTDIYIILKDIKAIMRKLIDG
jgi:hypothetical protein